MSKKIIAALCIAASLGATAAPKTTIEQPEWSRNAVIYEVNWRQITPEGTLQALEGQLPRIKELGADILWLMPVNPIGVDGRKGGLGSYYSVQDYKAVNPELGTMDDFRAFVNKAHDMGLKVIIDWVPNHSARDHWWIQYHPEFYRHRADGSLDFSQDWTDVAQFDYSDPLLHEYMIDCLAHWLYETDIDGFRCDVAEMVPVEFWDKARPRLQAIKPDLFMLAEASAPALQKNAFNMGYNWPLAVLFKEIANTSGQQTFRPEPNLPLKQAVAIDSLLQYQAENFPADTYLMNMITNHDFNSWEGTEFQRFGNLANAMAVLTYTLPGMPLIYTGQETGLNRAFEFFEKDVPPTFEPKNEYYIFYKQLNDLRHNQKALRSGLAGADMVRYPTKSNDLYIFSRTQGDSHVLVMVNLGSKEQKIKYTGAAPEQLPGMVNYFTGKPEKFPKALAPGQFKVYVTE